MTDFSLLQFGFGEPPPVEIGMATADEIVAVANEFAVDGDHGRQIDDWHLVAIRIRVVQQVTPHLIVRYQPSRRSISSPVVALAPDRRRAKTLNSVYALAEPANEPPTRDTLLRVTACMLISREVGHA
jgi:hypothetical protein